MARTPIDRNKLRAAIRKMGDEYVFSMLDVAIDLLSEAQLFKLAKQHIDPSTVGPDGHEKGNLLADVRAFEKASLGGEYYQDFRVNSQNCTETSRGTQAWMSDCRRLLGRCVSQAKKGDPAGSRQAFDILFGLLDHVDECLDDVIFFADEGGSWQVGVDWEKVLPAWMKVLSATADPEEYVQRITWVLNQHYDYGSQRMFVLARRTATPEQRRAFLET
jgi:hypothetical protein